MIKDTVVVIGLGVELYVSECLLKGCPGRSQHLRMFMLFILNMVMCLCQTRASIRHEPLPDMSLCQT